MSLAARKNGDFDTLLVRSLRYLGPTNVAPLANQVLIADGKGGTLFADPTVVSGGPLTDAEYLVVAPDARLVDADAAHAAALPSSVVRLMTVASPDTGGIAPALYREASAAVNPSVLSTGWQDVLVEHVHAFGYVPVLSTAADTYVGFAPLVEQREVLTLLSSPSALLGASAPLGYSRWSRGHRL
jgi:hypothetical protein